MKIRDLSEVWEAMNKIIWLDYASKVNWVIIIRPDMVKTILNFTESFNTLAKEIQVNRANIAAEFEWELDETWRDYKFATNKVRESYLEKLEAYFESEVELPWITKNYDADLMPISMIAYLRVLWI